MDTGVNPSQDSPWERGALSARELFDAFRNVAEHGGESLGPVLGGELFDARGGNEVWLQVWTSPTEVVVAYPPYGFDDGSEGAHEFAEWVGYLRGSAPLELGRTRGRSSYGATCAPDPAAVPVLKWAQRGDWMFAPHHWPATASEWPTYRRDPNRLLLALPPSVSVRKRILLGAAFCRNAPSLFEGDWLSARVFEAAEEFADGKATEADVAAACAAAEDFGAFWSRFTMGDSDPARSAFGSAPRSGELAERIVRELSYNAFRAELKAGSEQAATEAEYAVWAAEQAAQCDLVREVCGNPFDHAPFDPAWRTTDVLALARGVYDERAFDRMPILADALQDAGCDRDDILNHCRDSKQVHARGCWVIDAILGLE